MDSLIPKSRSRALRLVAFALLAANGTGLSGCASTLDKTDIKDIYGPLGRQAKNRAEEQQRIEKGEPYVGLEELTAARKLYDEQKYAEARKAFHKIVKKKKWKEEPVHKESLFFRAESDFQLAHYPAAEEGYQELLRDDPSSKYLDQALNRLFRIGCYWLNSPKPPAEIELASFTEPDGAEKLGQIPEANIPLEWRRIRPNFTDKTRPLFDTPGRGVLALKTVTLHDIQSSRNQQALLTLATYNLRKRDYNEADFYFRQLRESDQKIKEEYRQAAYVLGAHASLKSYLGAAYDGKQLEDAEKLTEQAKRLYPDIPQRVKLDADLKMISAEKIEREWKRVEFYLRRREKVAVAVYCERILEQYPDSPQAARAREILHKLGPQYAQGILTIPLFPKPKTETPQELEEPGRLKVTDEGASPAPVEEQP